MTVSRRSILRTAEWTALGVLVAATAWIWASGLSPAQAGTTPFYTFGQYSYDGSSCSTKVDPVTIVFTFGDGSYEDPHDHYAIADHGDWDGSGGGGQYFYDDASGCSSTDDTAGTSSWGDSGWHARWEVAWTTTTEQSYAATPHWDDWVWDIYPFTGTHCVPDVGFTVGRNETRDKFAFSAHDHDVVTNYWGNKTLIWKCGEWAGNWDGDVAYIDLR